MISTLVSDYAFGHCEGHLRGSVHSTFATSFNVDLDGFLLHVGSTAQPLSCLGLTVAPREMEELLDCVERGDRVVLNDGILRLYGRYGMGEVELAGAPRNSCRVPPLADEAPAGLDLSVFQELEVFDLPSLMGLPECARTTRALSELARYSSVCAAAVMSAEELEPMRVAATKRALTGAVDYLVGRGLGLTPSGDDVLCGFGTGLTFLYGNVCPELVRTFYQAVSEAVPGKTTAVSEAYLQAMVHGCANADYIDVLQALVSGDSGHFGKLFDRVLAVGHTSGADSLLGFAAAFCCLF